MTSSQATTHYAAASRVLRVITAFDLRLLLYVIRLAGWLKHCNLSLIMLHPATHSQTEL